MHKWTVKIIEKRWVVVLLFVLMGMLGYYSWKQLSLEAYPDIADVSTQVVTQVSGLAAEEMEQQITIPLERALNGLPGMYVMRSKSTFGLSVITIVFQDGVEDYWARMRIEERLNQTALPYSALPELDPLSSPVGEIFRYIVEGDDEVDLRTLTDLQHFTIIPRLKQITGVADVTNFGGMATQFEVEIDPQKMEYYGVALPEIVAAIQANNANAGGNVLARGEIGYVIRGIGLISGVDDLDDLAIKSHRGVPVTLGDIGAVKLGIPERKGVLSYTDHERDYSDSIEGIVLLLKGENPSNVLDGVHQAVQELNDHELPSGVRIHPFLDRTDLVQNTLHTVSRTMMEGIGLVVVILILFLGSWRGALLVAITIPISLLIAFILMYLTDVPANLLSLGAIDFGIIVDGSIVMLETILRKREDRAEEELNITKVAQHVATVAKPVFFSTVIIIVAYLPLFAFERVEKKLFTPMAFTVGYALLGALAVALVVIPGLAYFIYRKPRKIYRNRWLERLTNKYAHLLQRLLRRPGRVLVPLLLILTCAGLLSMRVGKDFLPVLDEGSIWLQVELPAGITLEKSAEMSDELRYQTMKYDEVSYVMIQAGRNDDGTDPWTPSHLEVSIGLNPYKTWPSGKSKQDLIAELAEAYEELPGYQVSFSQPMIDGVMDKIAGAHSELVVKVYGEDFQEIRKIASDIAHTLESVPGAVDLAIDQEPPLPQLQIQADRKKIAQYGLNVDDITQFIEVALGGQAVSQLFVGERVYDIVCRYAENDRDSPEKIANLRLTTKDGATIPLGQLADVQLVTGESTITREANQRHLTVKLNVRDRDLGALLADAQQAIQQEVVYDDQHYHVEWGGQFENQHRAYQRLALIVPLTLVAMCILLYGAFGLFRHAGLLMGIVPLAIFGGMLALNIRDMSLNMSSAVGFIALFGVAIQNGVIMISHINALRRSGTPLYQAVIEGAIHRFRPVLMTATVAILGLFPATLVTGIGSDIQRPLATVIVYGLLFSTTVTLFALPALYYLIERRVERKTFPGLN